MAQTKIDTRVLLLANEERNSYGLRYQDYARYRKHCAGRTHRLRQNLKLTHGKGKEFKKLPPVAKEDLKDGNFQLLFLEAERAWAYAQELNLQATKDDDSALRHRSTGRFRRALNYTLELKSQASSLFPSRISATSLLEITVYTFIMHGRFLLRRDDFKSALDQLAVARNILDELASAATTSRDQALYVLFADEIAPEIRYCGHSLGRAKSYDIDAVVADVGPKSRKTLFHEFEALIEALKKEKFGEGKGEQRKKLKELVWEGQPVPIRNPELVDVFLRVQEAEAQLQNDTRSTTARTESTAGGSTKKGSRHKGERGRIASYDGILLTLSDAEEVARKLAESQQLSSSTSTNTVPGAANNRDLQFVHAYTIFRLLSYRIGRDLLLVSSLIAPPPSRAAGKKSREAEEKDPRLYPALVKLIDTILQSLEQMRGLSVVDESPDLVSAIEARLAFTKAKRCFYLSRAYSHLHKYAETLALTARAHLHLREATSIIQTSSPISSSDFYTLTSEDISRLESEISSDELKDKKDWFALNGGVIPKADGTQRPHKKPLFFDIALNYVELPMDRLQARAGLAPTPTPAPSAVEKEKERKTGKVEAAEAPKEEKKPPPATSSGGLSSLLGGWWGRK